jgi:NADP-dependent 3-hydroxy acid dehydrogenase YdfG
VALVTGASSGIGKRTPLALVGAGFDVAGDKPVTTAIQQMTERFAS